MFAVKRIERKPTIAAPLVRLEQETGLFRMPSGEAFKTMYFVICRIQMRWVEWIPREEGGGFVENHEAMSDAVRSSERVSSLRRRAANGNDLVKTFYVQALTCKTHEPISFSIVGENVTTFQGYWDHTTLMGAGYPRYAHRVRLTSVRDRANHGTWFYRMRFAPADGVDVMQSILPPGDPLLDVAAQYMREMIADVRH